MLGLFLNVNDTLQAERCTPQYPTVALQRGGYAIVAPFVHAHIRICGLTQTHALAHQGRATVQLAHSQESFHWVVRERNQSNMACQAPESIMAEKVVRLE